MTTARLRLVRYADDFIICCATQDEAADALTAVESALAERRLRLNLEKTRIVPPSNDFEFLGYRFEPGRRVIPPETLPEVVRRRVVEFARQKFAKDRGRR
jgi:RNA-directed DNA polymerase